MQNPLLASYSLPPFATLAITDIEPALTHILTACREGIEMILASGQCGDWTSLCEPVIRLNERLEKLWSPVSHLHSVCNTPELREVYQRCQPLIVDYLSWKGQHPALYQAYRQLSVSAQYSALTPQQKKHVDNTLREFQMAGAGLNNTQQRQFRDNNLRLSELSTLFSNNELDATENGAFLIDRYDELVGIPRLIIDRARQKAEEKSLDGWLLTLDAPCYLAVMKQGEHRPLREKMYRAWNSRASDVGVNGGKWDNTDVIQQILALRHEQACLLGYSDYAALSLSFKMAKTPQQVLTFLQTLADQVLEQGQRELQELQIFAQESPEIEHLQPWDIAWLSEKKKQQQYGIDDEVLRDWFPISQVLEGMFDLVKRLYGLSVKACHDVEVWHEDVRFFALFNEQGEKIGAFYLDLYSRENKRGGAWMDVCLNRQRLSDDQLQMPVAYLVCNISAPLAGQTALLTHQEAKTLFHEFGHGLHHLLTVVDIPDVAGINNVPWDAVELPSQLMENWCYEVESLTFISGHKESGEPLPAAYISGLQQLKKHDAGLFLLRQIEMAMLDIRAHHEYDGKAPLDIYHLLRTIRQQVTVVPTVEWDRYLNTFSHIFAGGYAAGYYSYLWAEVLAADVWLRFKEDGILNRQTGQAFVDNILSCGGADDPQIMFRRFRGRDPLPGALLMQYGIEVMPATDKSVPVG